MTDTPDLRNVKSNAQWGGRFEAGPSMVMQEINASIGFDRKMWRQDIQGSLAHAAMLVKIGILTPQDQSDIQGGLEVIAAEINAGKFAFDEALEDIHMNIEARLTERIGDAGRRLHTGRSRNDQVATDFRLWVRDAIDGLDAQLADTMHALASRAAQHAADPMPSPSATTCWPMSKCSPATAAASPIAAAASTNARSAPPPWPAPPSRSTAQ